MFTFPQLPVMSRYASDK